MEMSRLAMSLLCTLPIFTYNMRHQDYSSEAQEAQAVRVHPHRPERKAGRGENRRNKREVEFKLRVHMWNM